MNYERCKHCGEQWGVWGNSSPWKHECKVSAKPQPLPIRDQHTLNYVATELHRARCIYAIDPWYEVSDPRSIDIIRRLKAIELEIEQLTHIPAVSQKEG